MKTTCSRCGQEATVTFTRRGTERIHAHKCPHGYRCQLVFIPATGRDEPICGLCATGVNAPVSDNTDEDGSPLDADNDPDS